ncbi:MAG: DUF2442 domain-containing protein [Planctomycetota bacterium]
MNPRVRTARANDDFTLTLQFDNGETRRFDMRPHLDFGVFRELKDPSYFKTVRVAYGTVQWPHAQDICPDTLYLESVPCQDIESPRPLRRVPQPVAAPVAPPEALR